MKVGLATPHPRPTGVLVAARGLATQVAADPPEGTLCGAECEAMLWKAREMRILRTYQAGCEIEPLSKHSYVENPYFSRQETPAAEMHTTMKTRLNEKKGNMTTDKPS